MTCFCDFCKNCGHRRCPEVCASALTDVLQLASFVVNFGSTGRTKSRESRKKTDIFRRLVRWHEGGKRTYMSARGGGGEVSNLNWTLIFRRANWDPCRYVCCPQQKYGLRPPTVTTLSVLASGDAGAVLYDVPSPNFRVTKPKGKPISNLTSAAVWWRVSCPFRASMLPAAQRRPWTKVPSVLTFSLGWKTTKTSYYCDLFKELKPAIETKRRWRLSNTIM
jgi:hypothetical protein